MNCTKVIESGVEAEDLKNGEQKRVAIIVLGMHRSGTSALTRCLNLVGADLPRHVFGVAPGNMAGHWEAERLIELNNQLLEACGSRWDDWRAVEVSQLPHAEIESYRSRLREILHEEYGDSHLLLIKDPRICRLAGFYSEVLSSIGIEPKFVIPFRDPLSVIESLHNRDGMTEQFAAALWLRHILDAERFSAGMSRVFVSYEELLADWSVIIRGIGQQLGVTWPELNENTCKQLKEFLSPSLRHHKSSILDQAASSALLRWAQDVYSALVDFRAGNSYAFKNAISQVSVDFEQVCTILGDAIFPELRARENKYSKQMLDLHHQASSDLASKEELMRELEQKVEAQSKELAACHSHNKVQQTEAQLLAARLTRIEASRSWRFLSMLRRIMVSLFVRQ